MFRLSHFNRANRTKTSKYLTLAFVISILVHGIAQITTAVWLLVANFNSCDFLQRYFVPVYTHLTSGIFAEVLALASVVSAYCYKYSRHVRVFVLGLCTIMSLELTSVLSAVILDKMVETKLPVAMTTSLTSVIHGLNSSTEMDFDCWPKLQEQYECCGAAEYNDWCVNPNEHTCGVKSNTLFENCKCSAKDKQDKCIIFNNETIYKASCFDSAFDRLHGLFRVVIAMDATFCITQCMSYLAVNCILSKLNSKCIVGTYKPKPDENEARF